MSPPKHLLSGTGKPPPEKSKFLQTCNRLSLFLKQNSNIRDLTFSINAKFDATGTGTNLFDLFSSSALDPPVDLSRSVNNSQFDTGVLETSPPAETRTIDFLSSIDEKSANIPPQYVILDSSCEVENPTNKASSSQPDTKAKAKTSPMTIFYGGKVMVLDDVPADRARDLMLVAQKGQPKPNEKVELASKSPEAQAKDSDLPIARRASLHKFLAKRKDRAAVRAPYQVHNQSPGGSSSGNDHSFDLNCNP